MSDVTFTWQLKCLGIHFNESTTPLRADFTEAILGQCAVEASPLPSPINEPSQLLAVLSFPFNPSLQDEQVRDVAHTIIERVVTILTFHEGLIYEVFSPVKTNLREIRYGYELQLRHKDKGGLYAFSVGEAHMSSTLTRVVIKPFASDKTGLENLLVSKLSDPEEPSLRTYRLALEASDPSTEFILHYAILASIYTNQKEIDDALDPEKIDRTPSQRSRDGETPFTRVRNELAHPKERMRPLPDAVKEATVLKDRIRDLAREHLMNYLDL